MNNISKNITYYEATKSQTAERLGIDNTPNEEQLTAMRLWAEKIFEPVRKYVWDKYGKPLAITCFFRSEALNEVTPNSSQTSQHPKGEAGDIDSDVFGGATNKEIFEFIRKNLRFDQLIWEYGDDKNPAWVHVSYSFEKNRMEVLRKYKDQRKYQPM